MSREGMIVVTGGAGFIGSNVVRSLNDHGCDDVVVVDDLSDGRKFQNLADCDIADYLDKDELSARIESDGGLAGASAVVHMGACSSTTQWDGRFMMDVNYRYSKRLWQWCARAGIPFVYASSASVYGAGQRFVEQRSAEAPLNVYAYSKFLFDEFVRRNPCANPVAGLRLFNVYGPREAHKGAMASVAWHFHEQLRAGSTVRLFEGTDGFANGEQRRDFVYVEDVCEVVRWCLGGSGVSGIFNVGTGRAQTFNELASAVIDWHGHGDIEYIPFPAHLEGRYQNHTEADLGALRAAGYAGAFRPVADGVHRYLDWLAQHDAAGVV